VSFVVVMQGISQVKLEVIRVAEGQISLSRLLVNRQALLVRLNCGIKVLEFSMAVSNVKLNRLVGG